MLTYRIVSARLPLHPQHRFDGGTYISVGIDYTIDPETGRTNVGCRRLSLRNRHEAGTNVNAPEIESNAQYRPILEALESTPMFFVSIMDSVGSRDGREVALELDELRNNGQLTRSENDEYALLKRLETS